MATTDSFSLHGFIDCFNHHIGHAALLQPNARWKFYQNIGKISDKNPVSHTETYESG